MIKKKVFNTEQRIEYLRNYAVRFFHDPDLNTQVVKDEEVTAVLARFKPPPQPEVRQRLPLIKWRSLEYKTGQHENSLKNLADWNRIDGLEAGDGSLTFTADNISLRRDFTPRPGASTCNAL